MRLPFFGLVVGTSLVAFGVLSFSACSSTDPRPDAGNTNVSSGSSGTSTSGSSSGDPITDSGIDAFDANVEPPTCSNTIKDGNETDVDCGGNVCKKCFDGKACIANTDCAGAACLNNVCITPKCNDVATNGDETDTDCGGSVCARCTIGKRCISGSDCVSKTCNSSKNCACPEGMTSATKEGGNGAYCIDKFEVSKYQYEQFYTANVNVNDQISVCKPPTNTTFFPRGAWPPLEDIPGLSTPGQGKSFNYSLPVHYVDWCDAHAYCKWAGKQLCGSVTGGSVPPDLADSADAGAWYNACSGSGNIKWPYGNAFDDRCNGTFIFSEGDAGGPKAAQRNGYGLKQDQGIRQLHNGDLNGNYNIVEFASCAGAPSDLYQMSGNVAEWEDSCDGANPDSKCRVRGGSFMAEGDAGTLSCKGNRVEQRVPPETGDANTDPLRDIGFRCCLY